MAYVVTRPKGRYEIRESVHTPKGPRSRSLANFARLDDEVLERARRRAIRPFDPEAVREGAARLVASAAAGTPRHERPETRQFVEASRRMARSLEPVPPADARQDPGEALINLLGLVARISAFQPPRDLEPLRFPPLAPLREARAVGASG
jgi:hypothetical protein